MLHSMPLCFLSLPLYVSSAPSLSFSSHRASHVACGKAQVRYTLYKQLGTVMQLLGAVGVAQREAVLLVIVHPSLSPSLIPLPPTPASLEVSV